MLKRLPSLMLLQWEATGHHNGGLLKLWRKRNKEQARIADINTVELHTTPAQIKAIRAIQMRRAV